MADTKLSALTSVTGASLADGDLFFLLDIDDNTFSSTYKTEKKITRAELVAGLATRVTFSNAAKTLDAADRYVGQTGTMSAARIVTLQAASSVPAGAVVIIADESGSVTQDNRIEIKAAGSDTIDGVLSSSNFPVIRSAYGSFELMSDGSSKWTVLVRRPSIDVQKFTADGTWRKPFGCSRITGFLIGAGGGGGGGSRTGTSQLDPMGSGAGGGAAGITGFEVPIADLGVTETVTVAQSAAGGAGRTVAQGNGDGVTGSNGGDTWFGAATKWIAQGGRGGTGGRNTADITPAGGVGGNGTVIGASGGNGYRIQFTTVYPAAGGDGLSSATSGCFPCIAPGGGGGGGGPGFDGNSNPAAGGSSSKGVGTNGAGLAGGATVTTATGQTGNPGTSASSISTNSEFGGGGGGGGGRGNNNAPLASGGIGGAGGLYGGGGGGGAVGHYFDSADAAVIGGGNGGAGAAGVAVIAAY